MPNPNHLIVALENIVEIAYSGHPDGREIRLELITRYANRALQTERELEIIRNNMKESV